MLYRGFRQFLYTVNKPSCSLGSTYQDVRYYSYVLYRFERTVHLSDGVVVQETNSSDPTTVLQTQPLTQFLGAAQRGSGAEGKAVLRVAMCRGWVRAL